MLCELGVCSVLCVTILMFNLWERVVLEYQPQNRVENVADVSTRCSGLLQGKDKLA